MKSSQLVDLFQRARNDRSLAVVEGVQALKHAVRFKADIQLYITCDIAMLNNLLDELAEDVKAVILNNVREVSEATFAKLSPQPPRTRVIALAKRKSYELKNIDKNKPIVFLEDPRDLENIGAVIRVSAAADVGAVIISGPSDIWHPAVIRGAAGLQYAIPVFCHLELAERSKLDSKTDLSTPLRFAQSLPSTRSRDDRQLVSLDPTGTDITEIDIPKNSILVFGTERHGISQELLKQSNQIVRLPMKSGVSSLNLATSVAATLFHNN